MDSSLPMCIDGKMVCPPEDCGGLPGYQELKKAIKNPKHPEHEDYLEWVGEDFDPDEFDAGIVNELLREENYGVWEY